MSKEADDGRDWFLIVILAAEILLIVATWPLWSGTTSFPAVPLLSSLATVPLAADRLLSVMLLANCAGWLVLLIMHNSATSQSKYQSAAFVVALVLSLVLAALNQHRLQPWHWLFVLVLTFQLLLQRSQQQFVRCVTVGTIYICAGASRLGSHVADGVSGQIAEHLLKTVGLSHHAADENALKILCTVMTVGELFIGLGLLVSLAVRRIRTTCVVAAVVMHTLLLVALGPWSLNHHTGVLLWNAFFVVAVPVLFLQRHADAPVLLTLPGRLAACAAILFPLSGLAGFADNWLSWQVYSPRPEVVRLYIHNNQKATLPESMRPFIGVPAPLQDWCPVRLDHWSLTQVQAPLYPEDRFQLAVAWVVIRELADSAQMRLTVESAPIMFWRNHQIEEFIDADSIRERANRSWLNATTIRTP